MTGRRWGFLAVVLLLPALAGCFGVDSRVVELYGGQAGFDIVQSSGRATTVRLLGEPIQSPGDHIQLASQTAELPLGERTYSDLVEILLDSGTYGWNFAKACEVRPGVAVSFERWEIVDSKVMNGQKKQRPRPVHHAEDDIHVLLCFECDILTVIRGDQVIGSEDFDPAREELIEVAKTLYPSDAVIQELE